MLRRVMSYLQFYMVSTQEAGRLDLLIAIEQRGILSKGHIDGPYGATLQQGKRQNQGNK